MTGTALILSETAIHSHTRSRKYIRGLEPYTEDQDSSVKNSVHLRAFTTTLLTFLRAAIASSTVNVTLSPLYSTVTRLLMPESDKVEVASVSRLLEPKVTRVVIDRLAMASLLLSSYRQWITRSRRMYRNSTVSSSFTIGIGGVPSSSPDWKGSGIVPSIQPSSNARDPGEGAVAVEGGVLVDLWGSGFENE